MPLQSNAEQLLDGALRAFLDAGTLDLSLDQLSQRVGASKRMLIHYFSGRENIELRAMARLEDQLRARFSSNVFPERLSGERVVMALWDFATAPESRGLLLLVMDISRRAWQGSKRARAFYREQQRLWTELLRRRIGNAQQVEAILLVFQGAILAYLITGDPMPGRRALRGLLSRRRISPSSVKI